MKLGPVAGLADRRFRTVLSAVRSDLPAGCCVLLRVLLVGVQTGKDPCNEILAVREALLVRSWFGSQDNSVNSHIGP